MRIDLDHVFEAFDASLELIDDERQREVASRVITASRDSVQRAVHDLLTQVAEEVNEAVAGAAHVELVYGPDGLDLNVTSEAPGEREPEIEIAFADSEIERLTLRLPAELKDLAAVAAGKGGLSLNAWLTRVVGQAASFEERAERRGRRHGRRRKGSGDSLRGWIGG